MVVDIEELELINAGCENVELYNLINNYGYKFKYKGFQYSCRHWLNCYGAEVDFWTLENREAKIYYTFSTLKKMINFIKSI